MMRIQIQTDDAPQAIGVYSQAVKVGDIVYLSGQIPLDPKTMQLNSTDFREQAFQVFNNMKAVCQAAGGRLDNIVKLTIFLIDLKQFQILNDVMQTFFSTPFPARSTIQVSALPKDAQIEIEAIMAL